MIGLVGVGDGVDVGVVGVGVANGVSNGVADGDGDGDGVVNPEEPVVFDEVTVQELLRQSLAVFLGYFQYSKTPL